MEKLLLLLNQYKTKALKRIKIIVVWRDSLDEKMKSG